MANIPLSLNSGATLTNHLYFNVVKHCLILYDVLTVKKHICNSISDHIDSSVFKNKKPTKKLLVLKWTKSHAELRNF